MALRLGIRTRFACVLAAVLLPPLGLFAYSVYTQRTQIAADAGQRLLGLAHGIADEHAGAMQISRTHLALLGDRVWYLQTSPEPCSRQLGEALVAMQRDVPQYSNLLLFDLTGRLSCSAVPTETILNAADRPWFGRVTATGTFTTTPYTISAINGDPVVGVAEPIKGPEGNIRAVLVGTLHVGRLSGLAASDLASGLVVAVFDREGRVLTRFPDEPAWLGRMLAEAPLVQAAVGVEGETVIESPGFDGTPRLTAIRRLPNPDGDVFVTIGHDTQKLFAQANRITAIGVLVLLVTALMAFGAAWHLGDRLLLEPVRRLAEVSRRVTSGELEARVRIESGDEFQELGNTFNTLLVTLAGQRKTLEANVAALQEERTRVQQQAVELAQTSVRLRGVIDAAPFAIIVPDHDYIVRVWSRGAEQIFGYTAEEIVGRRYPLVPEGGWPEFERLFRRVAAGETQHDVEVTRQAKDGRMVDIRFYGVPLRDPDGVIRSNLYTLIDITEEKKNRRKLEEATADLATLIEAAPVAIEVLDGEGRVQLWNPAAERLFGYSAAETIGHRPPHVAGDDNEFERYLIRLKEGGRITEGTWRQQAKDGRTLELQLSAASVMAADGTTRAFVFVLIDMTGRNLLQRQLSRSQRLESVGQLTGGLAHDFNNLLGIIIGNLELLTDDIDAAHSLRPLVDAAMEAGLRGAELNKSLLAFSRRQQLEPHVVDVNQAVEGMTKLLRRTLGEHIEIDLSTSLNVWPTLIDPAQLESAILNLAVNARDAMPDGGRLTIETSNQSLDDSYTAQNPEALPGDYSVIAVSDNGTGMSPDIVARVFEPFFTTKEVGKGTGLGLSMVYGFVKQSNGHVKIYSEVGRGTTIRLYLPRAAAQAAATAAPVEKLSGAESNETVLVVEDNESLRRVTVRELSRLGYSVLEADSAKAALALIESDARIDLLFSDVVMPGTMDGIALAQEATRRRPGLRVLLTSGFTERATRRAEGSVVPWRMLSKPYRRHDLAKTVREVMGEPPSNAAVA